RAAALSGDRSGNRDPAGGSSADSGNRRCADVSRTKMKAADRAGSWRAGPVGDQPDDCASASAGCVLSCWLDFELAQAGKRCRISHRWGSPPPNVGGRRGGSAGSTVRSGGKNGPGRELLDDSGGDPDYGAQAVTSTRRLRPSMAARSTPVLGSKLHASSGSRRRFTSTEHGSKGDWSVCIDASSITVDLRSARTTRVHVRGASTER